ncbi:thymidine kinase [Spiroplasma endosymbiont of Anurida maritima]|uniref:thymidine kinase n=1 Tax=Spiroplasma endosymbiont of Anurida maritima TaxID=2967972 RepID=UPI0036D259B5
MFFLNKNAKFGWMEIIVGCMFAGKTEEFIRRLIRLEYAKFKIQVFKPSVDNRYKEDSVTSHNNRSFDAVAVVSAEDLYNSVDKDTKVVGIDEVQFFDANIVKIANKLADENKLVIMNGLDKDFRGESFDNVAQLMALSENVKKLHAICVICGNLANRTQRIINGKPANYNDKIILIGEKDAYEARCRHCHQISNK